jgi:hypothetical protein
MAAAAFFTNIVSTVFWRALYMNNFKQILLKYRTQLIKMRNFLNIDIIQSEFFEVVPFRWVEVMHWKKYVIDLCFQLHINFILFTDRN